MREIKFRGKDVDSGKWHYGSLDVYPNGKCDIVVFDDGEILEYPIISESVGQFTGLHDKNGEEIYEGDVVCFIDYTYTPLDGLKQEGYIVYNKEYLGIISDIVYTNYNFGRIIIVKSSAT